jgi:hypothetical protein
MRSRYCTLDLRLPIFIQIEDLSYRLGDCGSVANFDLVTIIAIGVAAYLILSVMQLPSALAYATEGVRIDPSWIGRLTQP